MSARLLVALPLLCATLLLAAGGAPLYWTIGLAALGVIAVIVPWRGSLTTFGALLWMIAGASGPILWVRNTTTEPRLGLSTALVMLSIAAVRLFFASPLFGRGFDRALAVFACVAEGIGVTSAAYAYGAVVLAVALLVEMGGGFPALGLWRRTLRSALGVVVLTGLSATALALALPALDRATNSRFQALFAGWTPQTTFTPHVRLDEPGFIHTNDDVVLRLHGAEADYLRGAVFDSFDGVHWSRSKRGGRPVLGGVARTDARTEVTATEASPWLFAPRGSRILGDTAWEADALGALLPAQRNVAAWAFAPLADVVDPPADTDLTVPPFLAPKLKELAVQWAAGAEGDRARAKALAQHLRDDFTYTLDRPAAPHGQPVLLDFLFVHREGHCEFFASAFVVLARSLGIPARLVAGYRVVEHNGFGGYAVVRARHAHAWAEAYVPGADGSANRARSAFEVFDATPDVPTLVPSRTRTLAALVDFVWTSMVAFYDGAVASPERSVAVLVAIVLVALVLRAVGNRRRRRPVMEGDPDAPPVAFRRFEDRLAKDGFVRDRAETLESLAARLDAAGREALSAALRRYVKVRYGAGESSERELAQALEPGG